MHERPHKHHALSEPCGGSTSVFPVWIALCLAACMHAANVSTAPPRPASAPHCPGRTHAQGQQSLGATTLSLTVNWNVYVRWSVSRVGQVPRAVRQVAADEEGPEEASVPMGASGGFVRRCGPLHEMHACMQHDRMRKGGTFSRGKGVQLILLEHLGNATGTPKCSLPVLAQIVNMGVTVFSSGIWPQRLGHASQSTACALLGARRSSSGVVNANAGAARPSPRQLFGTADAPPAAAAVTRKISSMGIKE